MTSTIPPTPTFSCGDQRLNQRAAALVEDLVAHQAVHIHRLAPDWATQMAYYRFFANDHTTVAQMIAGVTQAAQTQAAQDAPGTHYLVVQDTTQCNFQWNAANIAPDSGLGVIGDGKSLGFFLHPSLAFRADDGAYRGFTDIKVWTRPADMPGKEERQYRQQPFEKKESFRWLEGVAASQEVLPAGARITVVQDREGDIFELFARRPREVELVVRSRDNRCVETVAGRGGKLFECLREQEVAGTVSLAVKGDVRQERAARTAEIEVRFVRVRLEVPRALRRQGYEGQWVWAVEARERESSVPLGESPIHWRILTTHAVGSFAEACQIIEWYKDRWYVETLFRLLKKKGFGLESAELESGEGLKKLAVLTLWAAWRVLCLYLAGGAQGNEQEAGEVFSASEEECLREVGQEQEGKTSKQQNPHQEGSLRWARWIIARLGGWKGYASQRRAGIITIRRGLEKFEQIYVGWQMAKDMYKP
jgi:hypothetical protein